METFASAKTQYEKLKLENPDISDSELFEAMKTYISGLDASAPAAVDAPIPVEAAVDAPAPVDTPVDPPAPTDVPIDTNDTPAPTPSAE